MAEKTEVNQKFLEALEILSGMHWWHYEGETYTNGENGDLQNLLKSTEFKEAKASFKSSQHTSQIAHYRISLMDGYDAEKIIELSNKKLKKAGTKFAVEEEWRRLKNIGSSQDPNAVEEAVKALNVLFPDGHWEMDRTPASKGYSRRFALYSQTIPQECAAEVEAFLESIGIHPMVALNIDEDDQEVGISHFDRKAFQALKEAAEKAGRAHREKLPEFAENPIMQRNDLSLAVAPTENPVLERGTQILAESAVSHGKLDIGPPTKTLGA